MIATEQTIPMELMRSINVAHPPVRWMEGRRIKVINLQKIREEESKRRGGREGVKREGVWVSGRVGEYGGRYVSDLCKRACD